MSAGWQGVGTHDGPSNELAGGRFEDRAVYVNDVANVDPLGQDLVFARAVSHLREHLERRDLGVEAVAAFCPHLNKHSPPDEPETCMRYMLLHLPPPRPSPPPLLSPPHPSPPPLHPP